MQKLVGMAKTEYKPIAIKDFYTNKEFNSIQFYL